MTSDSAIPPPPRVDDPRVDLYAEADVPTEYGPLRTVVFRETATGAECEPREHVALIIGDVAGASDVPTRVHSECWTGEVMHSLKCDCREQLDSALRYIAHAGCGMVLYLRQEGRGIGLGNKIRAYSLQAQGADTVDANRLLGFEDDYRDYGIASAMLRELDVRSIALLTNNPAKVDGLRADGVVVSRRVPMNVTANAYNVGYLSTKKTRMGHKIPTDMLAVIPAESKSVARAKKTPSPAATRKRAAGIAKPSRPPKRPPR